MSADGSVVVGYSVSGTGSGDGEHDLQAVRWVNGEIESLGALAGATYSEAQAVSADGSVVVGYARTEEGPQAFRWTEDGGMEGLGALPGGAMFSKAYGVSADGSVIVGMGTSVNGSEPFRWEDGEMKGLGSLSEGIQSGAAHDVSDDGSVVVGESGVEAFRWENDEMVGLGAFASPSPSSMANAVSADGSVVVGMSRVGDDDLEAFAGKTAKWWGWAICPAGTSRARRSV